MANVTINDEHLIAIGEALRGKLGETKTGEVVTQNALPLVQKTSNATGHDSLGSMTSNGTTTYTVHTIPGASSILIKCTCNINSSSCNLHAMAGEQTSFSYGTALWQSSYNIGSPQYKETTFSGTDTVTIKVYYKSAFYIEICGLDADGNEMPYYETVSEAQVPNTFKPRDMAAAITSISGGDSSSGGGGGLIHAHKTSASTLDDGTKIFDISETNGSFSVIIKTTYEHVSGYGCYHMYSFSNGELVKSSQLNTTTGRLNAIARDLNISYANGMLTVAPSTLAENKMDSNFIVYSYISQ